jgi:peroxiredoxin
MSAQGLDAIIEEVRTADGPLRERLATLGSSLRGMFPDMAEAVDRLVGRLGSAQAGAAAPKVGEPMPPFLLPDDQGRLVGLPDLIAQVPVIVSFARGHWCPYCRITGSALASIHDEVRKRGAEMVAICPDRRPYSNLIKPDTGARFPVLTDIDNGYALDLGLAVWVGDEVRRYMEQLGRDLPTYQGNGSWFVPIPATFVVGRDGLIRARHVDPDYRMRPDLDELLAALS